MKKILLLLMVVTMGAFTAKAQVLIEDYEGAEVFTYGPASGSINGSDHNSYSNTQYTTQAHIVNPVPVGINTSGHCSKFEKNPAVFYGQLKCKLPGNMTDAADYVSGAKKISLKVWTTAPVGTTIECYISKSGNGYPTGYHSYYNKQTTVTNDWETLVLNFGGIVDGGLNLSTADELNIIFAQASNLNSLFYFDDIMGPAYSSTPPVVISNEFLWTNFKNVNNVSVGSSDGVYTANVPNPAISASHLQSVVGQYDRSSAQYDAFKLNFTNSLSTVGDYVAGTKKFSFNVYSPAPGTNVELTLQNSGLALNNYPTGRYAIFSGSTVGTGWEKVILSFVTSPNGCLSSEINEAAIRFNTNTTTPIMVMMDSLYGPTLSAGPSLNENMIDNFETVRNITYKPAQSDGTFTNNFANPSSSGVNTSSFVGKYVRNGGIQFDVLVGDLNGTMNNAAAYFAGTKKITMKVYTTAVVGSVIELTFATAAANSSNYPTGRHSVYRAATTVQNAWQDLTFTFFYNPNSGADINQIQKFYIGFKANSNTNDTWYFDDIQGPSLTPLVVAPSRDKLWSSLGGASNYLYYTGADGALTQAANPGSIPTNNQAIVGKYVRSTTQYDVLRWRLNASPSNLAQYRSSAKKFSVNVYSPAPGTAVQFTLQNAAAALGGYPSGRAGEFLGTTEGTGWEHVTLTYAGQPDGSITDANINELAVLFAANSFSPKTLYIDSIYGPQFTPVAATAASLVWTGANSGDWSDAGNWAGLLSNWYPGTVLGAGSVPTASTPITIPGGLATYPSLVGDAYCSNLVLTGNSLPSLSGGSNLYVSGDITGSSNAKVAGTGKIIMNGTSRQYIYGSVTLSNLELQSTSPQGVFIPAVSTLRIQPVASSGSGVFKLNGSSYFGNYLGGKVILGSNSFGTAKLAPINPGATYDGNLTQERYVGSAGWHFVSAPFTSATTIADFNEAGVRVAPKNNSNIFEYTEPDTTNGTYNGALTEQHGWKVPASLGQSVSPAGNVKGYRLYASSNFVSHGGVLSTSGAPNRNNVSAPFTQTVGGYDGGGWNLIANPYPCEIDWNATRFDATVSNQTLLMGNAITLWNPTNNAYASWSATDANNGVAVNGGSRFVASSQAFFIKATGPGAVIFTELQKNIGSGNTYMRGGATDDLLTMTLTQGANKDEAAFHLHDGAAMGIDRMDAHNMVGNVDLSTVATTGEMLAINIMPALTAQVRIPLNVSVPATGAASLSFDGIASFATGTEFYLIDNFLATRTMLTPTSRVNFSVTSNPASKGASRFVLVVAPASVTDVKLNLSAASLSIFPSPATTSVTVALTQGTLTDVAILNALGKEVLRGSAVAGVAKVSTDVLAPGVYTVRATTSAGVLVKNFVKE